MTTQEQGARIQHSKAYKEACDALSNFVNQDNESQAVRMILIEKPVNDAALLMLWQEYFRDARFWTVSFDTLRDIQTAIHNVENGPYNLGRDHITDAAIKLSLCPIHFVDWAICFDDEPEDCSQVRAIFPNSHDT